MATPSDSPPSSSDDKTHNPVSQAVEASYHRPDAKAEAMKESSASVFVNSEPIREEQVQNAMKFLSHPKVRGSPVIYRRSFLERKGLTKEEIDEAFRRVPDQMPTVSSTQPAVSSQEVQIKSSPNVQLQPPTQGLHPTSVLPLGSTSKIGMLSQFHWYHAVLTIGFMAASGAGTALLFKKSIVPRLKSWIRKVVLEEDNEEMMKKNSAKPSAAEEAAAAAKAAAVAAADVARASQESLITKREEKRCFEELINMLNAQVREMKSMSNSIQKLESGQRVNERIYLEELDNPKFSGFISRQPYVNSKADTDSRSVRSSSPPAFVDPYAAPHPKSYIRGINDAPPNPNQPLSNLRAAPLRTKPWENIQGRNISAHSFPFQDSSNGPKSDYQESQLNENETVPWWQPKNARITEIKTGEEQNSGSTNLPGKERPALRAWVPSQPPPIVIPEAATAIRQPKKASIQADSMTDDARSGDATDELERISETGGLVEVHGGSSDPLSTDLPKGEDDSYLET